MENLLANLGGFILALVIGAIFLLLFAIILKVLRENSIFSKMTTTIMALCMSLLCIIGLQHSLLPGSDSHKSSGNGRALLTSFDLILLIYAALAIAIIFISLLMFLSKIFRKRKEQRYYREFNRGVERRYPFGRTSKDCEKPEAKSCIRK